MVSVIIVAAGKSERMGSGVDKAFLNLGPKPLVAWSLLAFEKCVDVDEIVLVVRRDQLTAAKAVVKMFGVSKVRQIVAGGSKRSDSVKNGLDVVDDDARVVLVHDAARPCVTPDLISEMAKAARKGQCAVPGHRIYDTVKKSEKAGVVLATEDRSRLWAVQTPQAFPADPFRKAYAAFARAGKDATDDAQVMEEAGATVRIIEWMRPNPKITTAEDLQLAAALLKL